MDDLGSWKLKSTKSNQPMILVKIFKYLSSLLFFKSDLGFVV